MADEYIKKQGAIDELRKDVMGGLNYESIIDSLSPADVIPIKWIQKKIDKSIGMEHAMWSKLLRMWENEQLRKYVRNLKDDNK